MKPLIVFIHTPKTAGMSLIDCLNNNFNAQGCGAKGNKLITNWSHYYPPYLDYKPSLQCIHGHLSISQFEALRCFKGRPKVYFTLLREPRQRTASYFYFGFRNVDPLVWLNNTYQGDYNARIVNSHVWMLSGDEVLNPNSVIKALDNIKKYNINIGFAEHFQESLDRWQVKYPEVFKTTFWEWQNKTEHKPAEINQDLLDEAYRLNSMDNHLYDLLLRRWEGER